MAKPPNVALFIETSRAYGRGLLYGIASYIHEHGPWSVYFHPQGIDAHPPPWLERWRGDGIVAQINNRKMVRALLRTRLPLVDVRGALGLPGIGPDNRAVAQLAFRHFFESGLHHFGFCTLPHGINRFIDARCDYFRQLVEQAGYSCSVYEPRQSGHGDTPQEQDQARLARWLKRLPKPLGIMACGDEHGIQVLNACRRVGLLVPDEVAVVGAVNDELLCGLANPPLSSVDLNAERIGYEAAALLDRLMAGAEPPKEVSEFPPRGLVVRQSSDMAGITDQLVAAALRFIREHANEMIGVAQVASALDISYSTLERRFVKLLGRTPKEEILRVQLARAQELLTHTNLPMAVVAEKAGFRSSGYFCEVFHRRMGCTPGAYRRDHGAAKFEAGS
jgi:LacI family transcriptional regulator